LDLAVSIVVYRSDSDRLAATLSSLDRAVGVARRAGMLDEVSVHLIDNDTDEASRAGLRGLLDTCLADEHFTSIELIGGHGNIGYGRGHNLVLRYGVAAQHLVLNPDVELAPESLTCALRFMQAHPDVGLLAPAVTDAAGQRQYLCRRHPSVLVLLLRGFLPAPLRRPWRDRLACYELRDRIDDETVVDVPLVSGCFMLLRRTVVEATRGFDPAYFLYFEDYDLSLRAARTARVVYHPGVRIVHHGGRAARKGWRHVGLFVRSAARFFNRHGWAWY
jgi:GT2 family glycosyltransferase